jgi:hypothetical protein
MKRTHVRLKYDSASGQSILEFAIAMPLILVLALGVVEVSYALLDQHVVTKLAREGSNLISRNTSLADAGGALRSMGTRPVDFSNGSKFIFSVVRKGATSGTNNYNKDILYQRYEYGTISSQSTLVTRGAGSFGSGPEYEANNADGDTSLQITNLPPNLVSAGGMVYITEIFTTHAPITPFDKFGVSLPTVLYSIAYF